MTVLTRTKVCTALLALMIVSRAVWSTVIRSRIRTGSGPVPRPSITGHRTWRPLLPVRPCTIHYSNNKLKDILLFSIREEGVFTAHQQKTTHRQMFYKIVLQSTENFKQNNNFIRIIVVFSWFISMRSKFGVRHTSNSVLQHKMSRSWCNHKWRYHTLRYTISKSTYLDNHDCHRNHNHIPSRPCLRPPYSNSRRTAGSGCHTGDSASGSENRWRRDNSQEDSCPTGPRSPTLHSLRIKWQAYGGIIVVDPEQRIRWN